MAEWQARSGWSSHFFSAARLPPWRLIRIPSPSPRPKNATQTNVTIKITASPGFTLPTLAESIQIKSINPSTGKAVITKNYFDIPLSGGQAMVAFPLVAANTPLNVQVNFKTPDATKSRVLRAGTVVAAPMDVAIIQVTAPGSAPGNTPFNVVVGVKELNGNLGATFDLKIIRNDTDAVVGTTSGASVPAGTQVSVSVSVMVPHSGPTVDMNFTALLTNFNPADSVSANNTALFMVTIQGPTPTFDAAITAVSAPPSVVERDPFNVDVTVQELIGTQGGTFDVQIVRNDTSAVIGSQSGVSIAAGGTENLTIGCSVSILGNDRTVNFTAQLVNISPADGTASNNTQAFSMQVFCSFDDFDCGD